MVCAASLKKLVEKRKFIVDEEEVLKSEDGVH